MSFQIDEEQLEDSITNLELVQVNLKLIAESTAVNSQQSELTEKTLHIVAEVLRTLRGFEVRNEIERFSELDE